MHISSCATGAGSRHVLEAAVQILLLLSLRILAFLRENPFSRLVGIVDVLNGVFRESGGVKFAQVQRIFFVGLAHD